MARVQLWKRGSDPTDPSDPTDSTADSGATGPDLENAGEGVEPGGATLTRASETTPDAPPPPPTSPPTSPGCWPG